MKQLYYVIRTLLRGRGSNIIKVISLGLGLTMSILLFSRVAFEQSYDTCYKDYDDLYQIYSIFSAEGEQFEPQKQNCGPVAGAILENFPKEVEAAASIAYFVSSPLYNGSVRIDARKILADSLFFKTMGIEVLSGNPEKDLMQNDVIFLSDDLAQKIYGGENPIGKVISYNKELQLTVCPRTLLCVRKLLFPCLRLGAVTGVTIPGAEATAITNISVSVRERTRKW